MPKIKNPTLNALADSIRTNRKIPSRKEIIDNAFKNSVSSNTSAIKHAAQRLRPSMEPMAQEAAIKRTKKVLKSGAAKDLAVNTGGFLAGKTVGDLGGGLPGAIAVDAAGASLTRRLLNKGYADIKAFRGRKEGEDRTSIQRRAEKKRKTLEKIDRKNNDNIGDVSGSIIGNTAAEIGNRMGIGIPMKGAAVAMRSNPQVVNNISKRVKGQQSTTDAIKNSVKDVYTDNVNAIKNLPKNIKRQINKGNARERLMRMKMNKKIQQNPTVVDHLLRDFKEKDIVKKRKVYVGNCSDFSESLYGYSRMA